MNYPLFLFFGLTPSVVWLLWYLRKDSHPEPKRFLVKIFLWGMLFTVPAIAIEYVRTIAADQYIIIQTAVHAFNVGNAVG